MALPSPRFLSMIPTWLLAAVATAQLQVVPALTLADSADGTISTNAVQYTSDAIAPQVEAFSAGVRKLGARDFGQASTDGPRIIFELEEPMDRRKPEHYWIRRSGNALLVSVNSPQGAAHAAATLLQLAQIEDGVATWPRFDANDRPEQRFRCFMVDLGRNPHGPEVLRQIVDACWFYKINHLQLHLTDDQLFSVAVARVPGPVRRTLRVVVGRVRRAGGGTASARGVDDHPGDRCARAIRRSCASATPKVFGKTPTELATLPRSDRAACRRLLDEFLLEVFRVDARSCTSAGTRRTACPAMRSATSSIGCIRYLKKQGPTFAIAWEGPALGEGRAQGRHRRAAHELAHDQLPGAGDGRCRLRSGQRRVGSALHRRPLSAHDVHRGAGASAATTGSLRRFAHVNHGHAARSAEPHVTRSTADGIVGFLHAVVGRSTGERRSKSVRAAPRRGGGVRRGIATARTATSRRSRGRQERAAASPTRS